MDHSPYNYIKVPVANMQASPSLPSEVISQALFSEHIHIIDIVDNWVYICTANDHYQGWVLKSAICSRKTPYPGSGVSVYVDRCAAHVYQEPDTIYGPLLTLPFESQLILLDPKENSDSRWLKISLPDDSQGYIQRGDVSFKRLKLNKDEICRLSERFMGLPYTWGGRSSFGYDCSGFVQMLYRQMGMHLPRDAKDQVLWHNFKEVKVPEMSSGDLIFFGKASNTIQHVGLHLQGGHFIHAVASAENAPYVRISHISDPAWNGSGYYPFLTARSLVH